LINRFEGATVKTMSDAVMATFLAAMHAVRATLRMLNEIEAVNLSASDKLALK